MNNDEDLDLLDLEESTDLDSLPPVSPFAAPRPKKPWLLLGIGLLVIILATYIIIRVIGSDSNSSIEVNLDAPEVIDVPAIPAEVVVPAPTDTIIVPAVVVTPAAPVVQPAAEVKPAAPVAQQATPGVPAREIADRKEVTFNPNKAPAAKPAARPAKKPVTKSAPAVKAQTAKTASWYVQFGSYSTRALAEAAQKKIHAAHAGLFVDKQFVVLAAVLPNGTTTYRLRIGFTTSAEANGFCRNAKSDGLDCYVAK